MALAQVWVGSVVWVVIAVLSAIVIFQVDGKSNRECIYLCLVAFLLLALLTFMIGTASYKFGQDQGVPSKPELVLAKGTTYEVVCSGQVSENKYIVNLSEVGGSKDRITSCFMPQIPPKRFAVVEVEGKTTYFEIPSLLEEPSPVGSK